MQQPQPNTLLGTLEDKMTKNLDKLHSKVKRHFRHGSRDKNGIFVPSSSASNGSSPEVLPRSTSHVEQPMNTHLAPDPIGNRRQSAPTPSPTPVMYPSSSMAGLTIDTFGGECAGSGYDHWLNEDAELEEHAEQSSYIQAQKVALNMVKQRISGVEEQLRKVKSDTQNLNDFIVSSFPNRLGCQTSPDRLRADIERLKEEIANLRALSPRSVPPERPPRPSTSSLYWSCPRCVEHTPLYSYRCKNCDFPRPSIDPNEAYVCNCSHCLQAVADRLFVSVSPEGDDWMLVNRLNFPSKK